MCDHTAPSGLRCSQDLMNPSSLRIATCSMGTITNETFDQEIVWRGFTECYLDAFSGKNRANLFAGYPPGIRARISGFCARISGQFPHRISSMFYLWSISRQGALRYSHPNCSNLVCNALPIVAAAKEFYVQRLDAVDTIADPIPTACAPVENRDSDRHSRSWQTTF